jgi:hypothetical protein
MGDVPLDGGAMSDPGLTAGPAAAGDIVTGRVAEVRTEWASREISPDPAGGIVRYRTLSEATVRGILAIRARRGFRDVLLRRTVTYGPWEEAGGG